MNAAPIPSARTTFFFSRQLMRRILALPGKTLSTDQQTIKEEEICYLRVIADRPGQPSSTYAKLARIGSKKALQIRKRMVQLGYIREHEVYTAKRGRPSIILELTPKAFQVLTG